jgi:hypothetical protein
VTNSPWDQYGGPQEPPTAFISAHTKPPKKRRRARNIILGIVGGLLGLIILAGIIGAATGGGKKTTADHHPVATAAHKPTAPSFTAAENSYYQNVIATYAPISGGTETQIVTVGEKLCAAREDGASQQEMVTGTSGKLGSQARAFVRATEKALCPSQLPQVIATFSGTGSENTGQFTVPNTWMLNWSYNCSSMGQSNFIVNEDGGSDPNGATVNELGSVQSGSTDAYNDAGTHYLQIIGGGCSWSLQVVS